MTTEKARKLLGYKYKNKSDQEIDRLVNKMDILVDILVDATITKIYEENNEDCADSNQSLII